MTADQLELPSGEEEIDLREVLAALQRRWRWIVGGGLLGLALAVGAISLKPRTAPQVQARLIVDVAQIPSCSRNLRQINSFALGEGQSICTAEVDSLRLRLNQLAKNFDGFDYKVDRLAFDAKGREKSVAHLVLSLFSSADQLPEVSAALSQIQQQMLELAIADAIRIGINPDFASDWILVAEQPKVVQQKTQRSRSLALGLLGGLVVGAGSGLVADRRSNRVYSQAELLHRLAILRLGLPAGPWTLQLCRSWWVGGLSLTKLVRKLGVLHIMKLWRLSRSCCNSRVDPISCGRSFAVSRVAFEPRDKPTSLLLLVEAGFNSARALEEAVCWSAR